MPTGGDRNSARCWTNVITDSCVAPLLYPSPKTHKPLDSQGDPCSRPVVQASSCLTSRPAEILADVIEGALQSLPNQSECISTEDMLARIDLANNTVRERGIDICVGSGDAVALYPSLRHKESASLCAQLIRDCPAKIDNVDLQVAAVFVATYSTDNEIIKAGLNKVIPRRKYHMGKKPTPSTNELIRRNVEGEECDPSKFHQVRSDLSENEIRLLIARVVEIGVLSVVRNHAYRWKDELWLQRIGVPTGLRLSGLVGRITMDHWKDRMTGLMEQHKMTNYLTEKYVDDCEVVLENLKQGDRWDGEKITNTDEDRLQDVADNRALDSVTMEVWQGMASGIVPGLKFTTDFCSKNENGMVAMLDFQLWKVREQDPKNPGGTRESLRYTFFEKTMSNDKVMEAGSAMPHKVKISSLTQEGVRRICNQSRELDDGHKCAVLSKFMWKLMVSGYSQATRANILEGAVRTFRRKEKAELLGIQPIHRLGSHGQEARRLSKISGRSTWYLPKTKDWKSRLTTMEEQQEGEKEHQEQQHKQQNRTHKPNNSHAPASETPRTKPTTGPGHGHRRTTPPNSRIEGIMFVPHTPGGALAKALQSEDDRYSSLYKTARVRIIERGGRKIKDILGRKDPWAPKTCARLDCMICMSTAIRRKGLPLLAFKKMFVMSLRCDRCKSRNVTANYYGESSRTPYLRGREHLQGQLKANEDNPLAKHDMVHHGGVLGPYSMKVIRKHKAPLARQLHESTEIEMSTASIIMNSKGEYNGARVPRITLEVGNKVLTSDYRGQEQAEPGHIDSQVTRWEDSRRKANLTARTSAAKRTEMDPGTQ